MAKIINKLTKMLGIGGNCSENEEINPQLEQLLNEQEILENASYDPSGSADYIFSRYDSTPVKVNVNDCLNDDEKRCRAFEIIQKIIEQYAELEYSGQTIKDYKCKRMINDFNMRNQVSNDSSDWELSISTNLGENHVSLQGFTASIFHNNDTEYPTNKGFPHQEDSQLRYRKTINQIELMLTENNIPYSIKTDE